MLPNISGESLLPLTALLSICFWCLPWNSCWIVARWGAAFDFPHSPFGTGWSFPVKHCSENFLLFQTDLSNCFAPTPLVWNRSMNEEATLIEGVFLFCRYGQAAGPLEAVHLLIVLSFADAQSPERRSRAVFFPAVAVFLATLEQCWMYYATSLICSCVVPRVLVSQPSILHHIWKKTIPFEGSGTLWGRRSGLGLGTKAVQLHSTAKHQNCGFPDLSPGLLLLWNRKTPNEIRR